MDSILRKRLEKFEEQIHVLAEAEGKYRTLEAAKDHKLSVLELKAGGESQSAKRMNAYSDKQWLEFKTALAIAETEYNRQRHVLELKKQAFLAEYLAVKTTEEVIRKQI